MSSQPRTCAWAPQLHSPLRIADILHISTCPPCTQAVVDRGGK